MKKSVFKLIFLIAIPVLGLLSWGSYTYYQDSSKECIRCHSDIDKLTELNSAQFYVTAEMIRDQTHHQTAQCTDCHLGNGRAKDKDKAHQGMVKMLIVGEDMNTWPREELYPGKLEPTGDIELFHLLPKVDRDGVLILTEARNILWSDRNPDSYNFDPAISKQTCGQVGCHDDKLKQFLTTPMARNERQRTMRTWMDPYGPHNCGPSFADTPPEEILTRADFSYVNTKEIQKHTSVPFTNEQARYKQQICNTCHTGCIDCHLAPEKGKPHQFIKNPTPQTCGGGGRANSMCHSGAMQARRGGTYVGGTYSSPFGMEPDRHYKEGLTCQDCHPTGKRGMGDMERAASCQDCHLEIEKAHAKSLHKNMDCASCHINELRGYQLTMWGHGLSPYEMNPYYKYGMYYGIQKAPILMRDQKGMWMPIKVMPHSTGNYKGDVKPTDILFRWPNGETKDAYAVIGTVGGLPKNNNQLLWMELQHAPHPFGKARDCNSCHAQNGAQKAYSTWKFMEDQGALYPFTGSYTIVADQKGLRILDLKSNEAIEVMDGFDLTDFASWVYTKDKFQIRGDFHIPSDRQKLRKNEAEMEELKALLTKLDPIIKTKSKKVQKQYKMIRQAALHCPEDKGYHRQLQELAR